MAQDQVLYHSKVPPGSPSERQDRPTSTKGERVLQYPTKRAQWLGRVRDRGSGAGSPQSKAVPSCAQAKVKFEDLSELDWVKRARVVAHTAAISSNTQL